MTKLASFLEWFAAKLPRKVIGEDCPDKGPLMIRYYLIQTRWFGVYLHKFLRSDERVMHDHPWWFWSLVLSGWYAEHLPPTMLGTTDWAAMHGQTRRDYTQPHAEPGREVHRLPGSLAYRPAKWVHRVELPCSFTRNRKAVTMPVWSLVLVGRRVREWGFWERDGWKRAEDHVTDCD